MATQHRISPLRALIPVGLGTGLSLIGDASLYAVLPTHIHEAGITLAGVGIILSVNRFIRILLNGPAGMAYDRWPRRPLFVASLFAGACSTAIYALTAGFWPLFAGRLLWGLAWTGIWVGGNAIVMDISLQHNRGRWVGLHQISFYMGGATGFFLGGFLTDFLGYHAALGIGAAMTLAGALVALFFLPETSGPAKEKPTPEERPPIPQEPVSRPKGELASAIALTGLNRLTLAGILNSTLGLLLLENLGKTVNIGGNAVGVASLTGAGLGLSYLVSMVAAPVMGKMSDRGHNRWIAVAKGLVPGLAGFALMALGYPWAIVAGLALTAACGGSNQGLSTAIVGDLSGPGQVGRRMGILFTVGDLTSAIGPPLAYALIPFLGLKGIYLISSMLLFFMLLIAVQFGVKSLILTFWKNRHIP